jgi:TPP-dependent pyruvate/acetoin dehydrogenase alpha subunit
LLRHHQPSCRRQKIFLEARTYRVRAHSSSDDPSRYRDEAVTMKWRSERDPLLRYQKMLRDSGRLTQAADTALAESVEAEVRAAIAAEESVAPPPLHTLVEDVFAQVPRALREQLAELAALPSRPPGHGP